MKRASALLLTVLLPALSPSRSLAVEALTTTADSKDIKTRREELKAAKAKLVRERDAISVGLRALEEDTTFKGACKTLGVDPCSALPISPGTAELSALKEEQKKLISRYRLLQAEETVVQRALARIEEQEHNLKSLTLSPSFQVNAGSRTAGFVPGIEVTGSFQIDPVAPKDVGACKDPESRLHCKSHFDGQMFVSIKPDPPAGQAEDVAQSIRVTTGVFSVNLGLNYHYFWIDGYNKDDDGPLGVEARLGMPFAYQRATATDSQGSSQPAETTSDFGLFSPELKLSVWLKYVLVGYKYSRYWAFGNSNPAYDAINKTGSNKVYVASRIDALSGDPGAGSPFFVEAAYTSGKNSFGGGSFSFGFSKSLTWNTQ